MGHKIFVSYKYADNNVRQLGRSFYEETTARTYVDALENYIKDSENIFKGESDNDDLSQLSEETIWTRLKDRIYDSTLTIVIISPNMKEESRKDRDQWIPWEISYSLKEVSRKNISGNYVKSASNAILAVVLPDRNDSYSYYIEDHSCCNSSCRTLLTGTLFQILSDNMFNIKKPDCKNCNNNRKIYYGESSYIISVKWDDFVKEPEKYIERAYKLQNSIEQYEIVYDINE